MTKIEIRNIIRTAAAERGVSYRITREDEVHFYGRMPNSIETGWYLVGQGSEATARDIQSGRV